MGNYLSDWTCVRCGSVQEELLVGVDRDNIPRSIPLHCSACDAETDHDRRLSRTAHYMPKPLNPMVSGGKYDTTGHKKLTPRPSMPDGVQTLSDFKEHVYSKAYQDVKEKRKSEKDENRAKRWRAGLIKQGKSVDMRTDKLPGDPKNIAS